MLGPSDAIRTDGIMLWGEDHGVNAGLKGLRSASQNNYNDIVLQLGSFITGRLAEGDLKQVCRRCKAKRFGKVSNMTRFGTFACLCTYLWFHP